MFGEEVESQRLRPATRQAPEGRRAQQVDPRSATKRQGHGRNGAAAYTGAEKVKIAHPAAAAEMPVRAAAEGKVYPWGSPRCGPHHAAWRRCRRRCTSAIGCAAICAGRSIPPQRPKGSGEEKYDETAAAAWWGCCAMGLALPFNRIEKLQEGFGHPLAGGTQWDLVEGAAATFSPRARGDAERGGRTGRRCCTTTIPR